MPKLNVHCAISEKRTGHSFEELHRWIDEPKAELGYNHRVERHAYNEDDKNYIKNYWEKKQPGLGEKAVIEWLFHIAIDNLDTAFKLSSKEYSYGDKAYNLMQFGMQKNGYIHCDFSYISDSELEYFEEEPEMSFTREVLHYIKKLLLRIGKVLFRKIRSLFK